MPREIGIDLDYIRTRSLRGDLKILFQTALVPLSKVARPMVSDPRVRRVEAGLLLGTCLLLMLAFTLASNGSA